MRKMKLDLGGQLSMHYESKTKGMEKVITENERLRKELKKVWSIVIFIYLYYDYIWWYLFIYDMIYIWFMIIYFH